MTEEIPNEDSSGRDVFVSYASQDVAVADAIVAALEKNGIKCWIAPRDVTPGALYADGIIRAINDAKIMVLVLSASSIASKHVGKEVERASSKGRPIIALKVDATSLTTTLEYFLSESQWIDVSALGLPSALGKLTQAVRQVLSASSDVNPELGISSATSGSQAAKRTVGTRRIALAATAFVAVGLLVALGVHFWQSKHPESQAPAVAAISDKSIAVLPFADMSQKKDQEYFGDGMAEEILDLLAKIPGLTVIGRTSSFVFKGKNEDLRKIGTELNAAYVLEGSVRNAGDQVRITAQLINTRTGAHEWSETYDRPIGDALKLQDEIAAGLARALEVSIGAADLQPRGTLRNTEAYQFYLRGRHAFDRYDKDGDEQAAVDFQKALDLEPTFANAAADLAWTRAQQAMNGFMSYADGYKDARRWAETALRLDPSLAEGHTVLADYYIRFAWDWEAARQEAKRARELDSRGVIPLGVSANLAATLGNWDEAVRLLNTALEFDPLNAALYWGLGNARYRSGRLPEAEAAFRRILQISPTFVSAHFELGRVLLARGQLSDALKEMERESPEPESGRTAGLSMVYYALGRRKDSDAALRRLEAESGDDWPFGMAETYAFRGEADKAFQWLERAYTHKDELEFIKGDPMFEKINRDPRYKAFLKKMNLPE